jgi:hypothetical protein
VSNLKSVKSGKTEAVFETRTRTLRGIEFTIRELDVVEYKDALKAAEGPDGMTPFQNLLDVMVLKCVTPSPASFSKPLPYPIYRTLEDMVNVMHFVNLPDEAKKDDEDGAEGDEAPDEEEVEVPNS